MRYAVRLLLELVRMNRTSASAWLLPIVLVILLLSALAVAVQLTVPFAMYTLF